MELPFEQQFACETIAQRIQAKQIEITNSKQTTKRTKRTEATRFGLASAAGDDDVAPSLVDAFAESPSVVVDAAAFFTGTCCCCNISNSIQKNETTINK